MTAVEHSPDRHAIVPDGVAGAATVRELNHPVAKWIAEMRLNLDGWRWLPNDLGDRYVLSTSPASSWKRSTRGAWSSR